MEYNELRDDDKYFSFSLNFEGMGAYPSSWQRHYCFDKRTGNGLTLDSLISGYKKEEFLRMLEFRQKENIEGYKKLLLAQLNEKEITQEVYEFIIEQIKDNCWESYDPEKFQLQEDQVVIIIDCEFPHAFRNLNPETNISISIKEFKQFVADRYQGL